MLTRLWRSIFFKRPPAPPASGRPVAHNPQLGGPRIPSEEGDPLGDVPRYPPFDTGIPLIPVDQVLRSQRELYERIFRASGMSRQECDVWILPVIRNLATYMHLLPATATSHHKGAGGLLALALQLGLHAMQGANAAVFPISGGVERRHFAQPRWALATLLAGLCSQIYRPICTMTVLTRGGEHQWQSLMMPLYDWAKSVNADRYFIRWNEESARQSGVQGSAAFLVSRIVPMEVMQYLAQENNDVVPAMTAAITGTDGYGSGNPIARILAPLITRVIEEDMKTAAMNYGHLSLGLHLEPHLIDAMRRLMVTTWAVNKRDSVVLAGAEGVFLDWPTAANDIVQLLTRDSFAGVPRHPDTLAEMLCAGEVFVQNESSMYWSVYRPETLEPVDTTVKLKQDSLIFPKGYDLKPYRVVQLTLESAPPASPAEPLKGRAASRSRTDADARPPAAASDGTATTETGGAGNAAGQARPREQARLFEDQPEAARAPAAPDTSTDKLMAALKPEYASLLRAIIERQRNGTLAGSIANIPNGLGISHEELAAHGQPVMPFIEELAARQWLWVDRTKPQRKAHQVEWEGKRHSMIVLRRDIARHLGFVIDEPCGALKQD